MRNLFRALPLTLVAMLIVLAAACGGTSKTTSDQSSDLGSSDPLEVLTSSVQSLQGEVDSVETELEFSLNISGFDVEVRSETAFQAPDQMHMTLALTGQGEFEMLLLGTDIYMNVPGQGWIVMSLEELGPDGSDLGDLGVDIATFQDLLSDHSLIDYAALVQGVDGEVEDLGDETIDGATYRHYRGTVDFASLIAAFNDAFDTIPDLDSEDASGPLTFDVWVDPDTYLPYKMTTSGEFDFGAGALVFDAEMLFTSYNEPVEIPDAPQDAVSLSEMFSGLLEGLEDLDLEGLDLEGLDLEGLEDLE